MYVARYLEQIPLFSIVNAIYFPAALVQVFIILHITIQEESVCTYFNQLPANVISCAGDGPFRLPPLSINW